MGHLFHCTPTFKSVGDSSCEGGGGFGIELRFWWHLSWRKEVYKRTKVFVKNNKKGRLISINVLEFKYVIVNFCAALTALELDNPTDDPHPILLNEADNTSSIRWCNHARKSSLAGRALGRFFCMLLVDSPLGINSTWISTKENKIADAISRLRSPFKLSHPLHNYSPDYSLLKQQYPQLAPCRLFQPSPELLSILYKRVLENKSPSLIEVRTLKQNGLGKLTS